MQADTYLLRISRIFYYVILIIYATFFTALIVLSALHISVLDLVPWRCSLRSVFGLYCPGCGGTRAVYFLLHGKFVKSFIYNPTVIYAAAFSLIYVVSHTLNLITRGRIKALLFRPVYFYIMIGIITANCLVKNLLVIFAGIYLI